MHNRATPGEWVNARMETAEDSANPVGEFVGIQQPVGLYNLALAVDPFGFGRVEPRSAWAEGNL